MCRTTHGPPVTAARDAKRFLPTHQNVTRKSHRKHGLGRSNPLDARRRRMRLSRTDDKTVREKSTPTQNNNDDNNNKIN